MELPYSRIAVPKVHIDLRLGLTGVGVDDLDVHVERNATLVFGDVGADIFAGYVYTQ
jgi:hypothetical protein